MYGRGAVGKYSVVAKPCGNPACASSRFAAATSCGQIFTCGFSPSIPGGVQLSPGVVPGP